MIEREVDTDLFSAVIHHIIGQQISTKAQATIWKRMKDQYGIINADTILSAGVSNFQSLGISFRKAGYITDFARKVKDGTFDIDGIWKKSDEEAIKELSSLQGIGVWTAEMILLFCMQRPNVLSFGDLAIQRGMRMIYHHRKIDRKLFEKIPAEIKSVLQCGKPVFLGCSRRFYSWHEGFFAPKKQKVNESIKLLLADQNNLISGYIFPPNAFLSLYSYVQLLLRLKEAPGLRCRYDEKQSLIFAVHVLIFGFHHNSHHQIVVMPRSSNPCRNSFLAASGI